MCRYAALRYFNRALDWIADKDLSDDSNVTLDVKANAYNARFSAATCALVCADKYKTFPKDDIRLALNRINICIDAVPDNPYLKSMRVKAESLLE